MQSDCTFIRNTSAPGMQVRSNLRGAQAAVMLAAVLAASLAGCGGGEQFLPYDQASRAPAVDEQGPHQGHLVDVDRGAYYAEVVLDKTTRHLTVYVLQDDFLKLQPVEENGVALNLVEKRALPVRLEPQPQANDPPGQASRFVSSEPLPDSIRTTADLSGVLQLNVGGKPRSSPLHRDDHRHDAPTHPPVTASVGKVLPQLTVYCLLIVCASFGGGWLPSLVRLTHTRMQVLISLVGGLMLGIGLLHLLPHAVAETGSVDAAARWTMFGLLTMFFLIRAFHFHQHGVAEVPTEEFPQPLAEERKHDHDCGHDHDHDHAPAASGATTTVPAVAHARPPSTRPHDHDHRHGHGHSHAHDMPASTLSWMGVAVGLGLHTAIDGMVLAASMQSDAGHLPAGSLLGLAPFAAIVLHKPLDAVSITSLMQASGWSKVWQNVVNFGFALMCPLGAAAFLTGMAQLSGNSSGVLGAALAFSAGVFLCISLGDLLPELEFHSHHRVRLSIALIVGILAAWAIGFIEPAHLHGAAGHHH